MGLLFRFDVGSICTGTLIGCQTFLTAAHCVAGPFNPAGALVFFPHRGFVFVTSAAANPDWIPFFQSDMALVTLSSTVTGIAPFLVNTVAQPPLGSLVDLVGFGSIGDANPTTRACMSGVLRRGHAVTSLCTGVPEASHVCFSFITPRSSGRRFPAPASATRAGRCSPPSPASAPRSPALRPDQHRDLPTPATPFHADVDFDHDWIVSEAAGDLAPIQFGTLPTALGPGPRPR